MLELELQLDEHQLEIPLVVLLLVLNNELLLGEFQAPLFDIFDESADLPLSGLHYFVELEDEVTQEALLVKRPPFGRNSRSSPRPS